MFPLLLNVRTGEVSASLICDRVLKNLPKIKSLNPKEVFPEEFKAHARRLYATQGAIDQYGGEIGTPENIAQAFEEGYGLVFHNGHGLWNWLTYILDSEWIRSLRNDFNDTASPIATLGLRPPDNTAPTMEKSPGESSLPKRDSKGSSFLTRGLPHAGITGTNTTSGISSSSTAVIIRANTFRA